MSGVNRKRQCDDLETSIQQKSRLVTDNLVKEQEQNTLNAKWVSFVPSQDGKQTEVAVTTVSPKPFEFSHENKTFCLGEKKK